jgi:hypothetical protein
MSELEWVKIKIQGNKDLHMPHRNVHDIEELDRSLNLITESKACQVVLVGDFLGVVQYCGLVSDSTTTIA